VLPKNVFCLSCCAVRGLSSFQLDQVFHAIIISRLRYALPLWSGYLSIDLINRIQSMLKRLFKFGYTTSLISFQDLINSCSLFQCMNRSNHCLHHILSSNLVMNHVQKGYVLVGMAYTLPTCISILHRQSFLIEFCFILCNICHIVFV